MKCKYAEKSGVKGYITCSRDGSRRKATIDFCRCPCYKVSWWSKFLDKLFN